MRSRIDSLNTRTALLGTTVLAGVSMLMLAAAPAFAQDAGAMETVTVTGYRASLTDSTNAKRASVSFTDSVFAEDIGKFPDTNIAESLNRIPGVTITRDANGEGVNVSIRGLGTNFTKILLNGNPITVASTGAIDALGQNREVDLNMFPTELFTQLTVSKTPTPDMIEGGAAGSINMRSMRPFDNPGLHVTYNAQLSDQSTTNMGIGKRGTLIFSDTEGPFGILLGISGVQSNYLVHGWEDGNAGWNTPNLPGTTSISTGGTTGGACGAGNVCAQFGGNAWTIGGGSVPGGTATLPSGTVPPGIFVPIPTGYALAGGYTANVVSGVSYFPAGYPINNTMLYALNPGLAPAGCSATTPSTTCLNQAMTRLSNAMLPRLGRPMFEKGSRDRYNAILSAEFRPSDDLQFYVDAVFGRVFNDLNRSDIDWGVRGGNSSYNMIPANLTIWDNWLNDTNSLGLGGAVKTGTLYGAVYGLEARPYKEKADFISINPGASWQASELLKVDFQTNYTRGHFMRVSPTVMVTTCASTTMAAGVSNCPNGAPALGTVLDFNNTVDGQPPVQTINLDTNDPNNWEWALGRVNLQSEKRYTYTLGAHLDVTYGGDKFAIKAGAAYDENYRFISAVQDDGPWQNAICGGGPNVYLPGPNGGMPACTGQASTGPGWIPAQWLTPAKSTIALMYPGYGTGYTTGFAPLTFAGSAVPTSQLANYLLKGPYGFVTVDYNKIFAASGFDTYLANAWKIGGCTPNCNYSSTLGIPVGATPKPPFLGNSNTNALTGGFDERTTGLYMKAIGSFDIGERKLKYDVGLRWVETRQLIITPVDTTDPRNGAISDGGKYPNYFVFPRTKSSYQAFLPSISAVYEIADDFQVRASISRTMNRPNPSAMVGSLVFSDPNVASASLGNPNLAPYYSNNIDLGAELYTGGEGYIGMTLFRKSISGFYAQLTTVRNFAYLAQYGITWNSLGSQQQLNYQNSGGPTGIKCHDDATCADEPINVTQQVNLKGLEIMNGMEFDYVQPLDFLTEPYLGVKGFGLTANLTIIDQKSTGAVATYATGVPPLQYNLTGYYEDHGIMLRVSYNWNDRSYNTNTGGGSYECWPAQTSGAKAAGCPNGPFQFNAPYGQMDFSSSLQLSDIFGELPSNPELTFDVQNVLSAKQKTYVQYSNALHNYFIKGQTYMVGLRGSF